MKKIAVEEALRFADTSFPDAPEKIAELLQIEVRRSVFQGDGWCLRHGERTLIRLNSSAPPHRQRFTLAHELGHFVLEIPSVPDEKITETRKSESREEKLVNRFAAQLLLPAPVVKNKIREVPVETKVVKRLAKEAKVSELFVLRRLVSLSKEIGLIGGDVLYFEKGRLKWHHSQNPEGGVPHANQLLRECLASETKTFKKSSPDQNQRLQADLFSNPGMGSHTLFVQIVRSADCPVESSEQKRARLEGLLLKGFDTLRPSFQSCVGQMKRQVAAQGVEDALQFFNENYLVRKRGDWGDEFCARLASDEGQNYLRLRFDFWIQGK